VKKVTNRIVRQEKSSEQSALIQYYKKQRVYFQFKTGIQFIKIVIYQKVHL